MKRYTIPLALATSWLGFLVHNVADLPPSALIGPETTVPTAVYLMLFAAWLWWPKGRRRTAKALSAWGWLHFLGGGLLSVLPLPLWPFDPPQTLYHYTFHAVYAACQIPLMVWPRRLMRAGGATGSPA